MTDVAKKKSHYSQLAITRLKMKQTQATLYAERQLINELRMRTGLNLDGMPNGNGLLGRVKNIEDEIDTVDKSITKLSQNHEKLFDELKRRDEKMEMIIADIKEIKLSLKDNIDMNTIRKIQNATRGLFVFLSAISGIIGYIVYIISKIN